MGAGAGAGATDALPAAALPRFSADGADGADGTAAAAAEAFRLRLESAAAAAAAASPERRAGHRAAMQAAAKPSRVASGAPSGPVTLRGRLLRGGGPGCQNAAGERGRGRGAGERVRAVSVTMTFLEATRGPEGRFGPKFVIMLRR